VASKSLKTYVYIDGFNLYYGALRKTRYKWLDLAKFCQTILPNDYIVAIKYFTAKVSGTKPGLADSAASLSPRTEHAPERIRYLRSFFNSLRPYDSV
jgi:hypothetical protein